MLLDFLGLSVRGSLQHWSGGSWLRFLGIDALGHAMLARLNLVSLLGLEAIGESQA